jgi:hypothetical protein
MNAVVRETPMPSPEGGITASETGLIDVGAGSGLDTMHFPKFSLNGVGPILNPSPAGEPTPHSSQV